MLVFAWDDIHNCIMYAVVCVFRYLASYMYNFTETRCGLKCTNRDGYNYSLLCSDIGWGKHQLVSQVLH